MSRRLLLVRHAQVVSELAGRFVGATDAPLGTEGLLQAESLARQLRARKPKVCLCSPLTRTQQTAQRISEATGATIRTEEDLREINFGEWEGKTFSEVSGLDHSTVNRWAEFAEDFSFPGGESLRDFLTRIGRLADRLTNNSAEELLIVTHGGVIRALICHFLGLPPRNYLLFEVHCASLTTIELFEGRGVLSSLNQLTH